VLLTFSRHALHAKLGSSLNAFVSQPEQLSAGAEQPSNQAVKRIGTHLTKSIVIGAEVAVMPITACFLEAACNTDVLQTAARFQYDDLQHYRKEKKRK